MRLFPVTTIVLLLLSTAAGAAPPAVEIELPALFGNHMVLQRDIELPVWGTARPGGEVLIRIAGQRKTALVDEDGSWHARLDPLEAGGPYELIVEGEGRLRFSDVLVGEVWLASGQSNMAMPLAGWGRILDFEQEIARADYPEIRLFQVERDTAVRPRSDVPGGRWRPCSSESVAEFSSTAYFFGRRLHRELGVPVGLIHSSWGGTVAEAWTGGETLTEMDDFRDAVQALREASDEEIADMRRVFEEAMAVRQTAWAEDAGLVEGEPIWADPSLEDSAWASMELPTMWEDAGLDGLDGVVWYRREVELPEGWAGSELRLSLGTIDDADETYFNGVRIGAMDIWNEPRSYTVPAGIARAGRNVIAVRVLDNWLSGGISGEPHDLGLEGPTGPMLGLAGSWRYRISVDSRELDPLPPWPDDPNQPTVLYNAMLRPLAPYAIRGAIWYQGESNVVRAHQYRTLFPALIRDWRTTWGQGNFPFYFVQLANFLPTEPEPGESDWAELREAQLMALSLPNTGMAVAIDIGNAWDIHPKNKQEVGNRLARLALNRVYQHQVADSGPLFREMRREGTRVRLFFDHADGGLEAKGGALKGFAIAAADRRFRWAEAMIDGRDVVVWNHDVPEPVAVRYGWAANPVCNLYGASGLPASPFRTDSWPGVTEEERGEESDVQDEEKRGQAPQPSVARSARAMAPRTPER
jgi:sialate O-acetylesterase